MNDFYFYIKQALEKNSISNLIENYSGDPNLSYGVSDELISIKKDAFFEQQSKRNSLEFIFNFSKRRNREIPFSGIIDENLIVSKFVRGKTGLPSMCDWEAKNLLKKSKLIAKKEGKKISLGHTHPVFKRGTTITGKYGAICSDVYFKKIHLGEESSSSKFILESGIYEKFGGDYSEMFFWSKKDLFSNFFFIMSSRLNQLGVFRLEKEGKIFYHPWKIID